MRTDVSDSGHREGWEDGVSAGHLLTPQMITN